VVVAKVKMLEQLPIQFLELQIQAVVAELLLAQLQHLGPAQLIHQVQVGQEL
jgi:hypothetical protein